jgi:hypothetical protein
MLKLTLFDRPEATTDPDRLVSDRIDAVYNTMTSWVLERSEAAMVRGNKRRELPRYDHSLALLPSAPRVELRDTFAQLYTSLVAVARGTAPLQPPNTVAASRDRQLVLLLNLYAIFFCLCATVVDFKLFYY